MYQSDGLLAFNRSADQQIMKFFTPRTFSEEVRHVMMDFS